MEYWHVMNRGVEKRLIAMDDTDRVRFVRDLYLLNNVARVENVNYISRKSVESIDAAQERLVTIHAWCLMGNHYHLLLSELEENGVSKFLQKFNGGYTMYFNTRHERVGGLFQGKTKRVLIKNNRQFLYMLPYIHLNPLDFHKGSKEWRRQSLARPDVALSQITAYRWSSYRNYAGATEFSEILEGSKLYSNRREHIVELRRFLKTAPSASMSDLALE